MKKILVVRFSSIGDIVLTSPVLRALKEQKPDWTLHFLTKSPYRPLVAHNPNVDKLFGYDSGNWGALMGQLRREDYDFILDLHNNWRTRRLSAALKIRRYAYPKANIRKWLLVRTKQRGIMDGRHVVSRYFRALKPWGIEPDDQGLDYFIPHYARLRPHDLPLSHSAGYLIFSIGGSFATKRLPVDQWVRLAAAMDHPIILLGGEEDREMGEEIARMDPVKLYNACGKFSLPESAWLVAHSRLVLTNDTGMMHIASAFHKPIISFWGNTVPEFGMYPYFGPRTSLAEPHPFSYMVENRDLSCRPCSKLGFDRCPKGHFRCMKELPLEEVLVRVEDILRKSQRPLSFGSL